MTAEIVSVGTELLMGDTVDTNAATLGKAFARCGVIHRHRQTVGDNLGRLIEALKLARSRSDLVVTIGGLGPTQDDLTRDGIAGALGVKLVHDPEVEEGLRRLFASRGLRWAETNLRQALKPEGAEIIPNPNGTAPGFWCRDDEGGFYCALPGPPNEFNPMVESFLIPRLASLGDGLVFHSTVLKIAGIGESRLEEILGDLMAGEDPTMSPYAKTGEVHLRLTTAARSAPEAAARLDPLEAEVRRRVGPAVYARNDESMAQAILNLLVDRRETLALAESMTCGMIGAELTSVSGMSAVLKGGVMAYSRSAKSDLLGVPHDLPVYSAECAAAMATGARRALAADWGLSVTGLAQADGSDVPAGSVWIGVSGPGGVERVETHRFIGTREAVRQRTTTFALGLLRRLLLGLP